MQTISALWNTYYASANKTTEYKAVINEVDYLNADIYSISVDGGLCKENSFNLGKIESRRLVLAVKPKGEVIPKMATVDLYMRYNGASGPTEWLPKGKFLIDTRDGRGAKLILTCCDRIMLMGDPFLDEGPIPDFPMPMPTAMARICVAVGLTLDNPAAISSALAIEYPNDLTMREVAGYIASANGGNWTITDAGALRLVAPAAGTPVDTVSHKSFNEVNDVWTISRVTMYYDDEQAFTSGNDTGGNLIIDNPWATQAMCDHVLALVGGYTHKPFICTGAYIHPAAELGDTVTMAGFQGVIFTAVVRYGAGVVWDISAPGESTLEHEVPYEGTVTRAMKRKVTLGANYYGTSISRKYGLKVEHEDNETTGATTLNSKEFRVTINGKDVLWADWLKKTLMYDGEFSASAIAAMRAEIDVIVTNITITNVLAAEKGYIAELTVDQLDTSTKVQKYIAEDTSAVNYIRIIDKRFEFITAEKTGTGTDQAADRHGNLLYWKDAAKTEVTMQPTEYPILTYQYDERVKLKIFFEGTGSAAYPVMEWGEGSGVDQNEKAIIKKDEHGLHLWYWADAEHDGDIRSIDLRNDGVYITPWELEDLQFYNNGFTARYSGQDFTWGWTKDGSGRITKLTNEHGEVTVGWNSGGLPA